MKKLRKLGEGVYLTRHNQLEFDIPELLRCFGYSDTPANRDLATALAIKAARKVFPQIENAEVITSNPQATAAALASHGVRRVRIRRNDRCPCGSGGKYKHCCIGNN